MDNTLLIWKYLKPLFTESQELNAYMSSDYIYPLVALADTPFPYIIYKRDSLNPNYTKYLPNVGGYVNNIQISVTVYSDNYDESVYIANIVRDILEGYNLETEEIKIHPVELLSCYEAYSENGFQQTLTFNITAE